MTRSADAIVVGGGIHGASVALHLARLGIRPLVVERHAVATGATGRSDGLIRMHHDFMPDAQLAWWSFRYFQEADELIGPGCGFRRTGFLQFVRPGLIERLRANVGELQQLGIRTSLVSASEIRSLAPMLAVDDETVAAFEPESGYADPAGTAMAFLEAARRMGARLVQGRRVTAIAVRAGRVVGVKTDRGGYSAPIVINCAGAWAAEIGRMVGLELPVKVWRHSTAFLRLPPGLPADFPAVFDDANGLYFRPEGSSSMLAGLKDESETGGPPDRETMTVPSGFGERVAERILTRCPSMAAGTFGAAHSGQDGITPDQKAIIGQVGPDGFYAACGFSGTGFKTAPAVGAALSELVTQGRSTTIDISPYGIGRFEKGRLLVGTYPYDPMWR